MMRTYSALDRVKKLKNENFRLEITSPTSYRESDEFLGNLYTDVNLPS